MMPFFTIGHSSCTLDEFLQILTGFHIDTVVDIRRLPGSDAFPHFNQDALASSLKQAGVHYLYMENLGGRRGRSLPEQDRRNAMWRNKSFRYYADYASSETFHCALKALIDIGQQTRCAMMCAEAVWWRCHRRIIADHLIAHGYAVYHIMAANKATQASLTKGARVQNETVTYPAGLSAKA